MLKEYRVKSGNKIELKDFDPEDQSAFDIGKKRGVEKLEQLVEKMSALQELLYAEHQQKVLIVLQGMDTSGKDGTIRHVFRGVNPQGVRVTSFKIPTPVELDHDFLWRVHAQVPQKGEIVIFNRSHYEDVLVVRVHELVPEPVWQRRYKEINEFERLLAGEGTTLLKFFLHISQDEQKKRLQERLDNPDKHWKFNVCDLAERKLWSEYQRAYEDALNETSTPWAPWYIVPSNSNWYRNLVVSSVIVRTLEKLKMNFPEPKDDLSKIVIE